MWLLESALLLLCHRLPGCQSRSSARFSRFRPSSLSSSSSSSGQLWPNREMGVFLNTALPVSHGLGELLMKLFHLSLLKFIVKVSRKRKSFLPKPKFCVSSYKQRTKNIYREYLCPKLSLLRITLGRGLLCWIYSHRGIQQDILESTLFPGKYYSRC